LTKSHCSADPLTPLSQGEPTSDEGGESRHRHGLLCFTVNSTVILVLPVSSGSIEKDRSSAGIPVFRTFQSVRGEQKTAWLPAHQKQSKERAIGSGRSTTCLCCSFTWLSESAWRILGQFSRFTGLPYRVLSTRNCIPYS
jgi:hypothetical protein